MGHTAWGLCGCGVVRLWGVSSAALEEEGGTSMIQPPFPSKIEAQPRHFTFLTTKTAVRKNQENDGQTGSPCLDQPVLAQGRAGGGGGGTAHKRGHQGQLGSMDLARHVNTLHPQLLHGALPHAHAQARASVGVVPRPSPALGMTISSAPTASKRPAPTPPPTVLQPPVPLLKPLSNRHQPLLQSLLTSCSYQHAACNRNPILFVLV